MLPWLIGAAAVGLAYLLYRLLKHGPDLVLRSGGQGQEERFLGPGEDGPGSENPSNQEGEEKPATHPGQKSSTGQGSQVDPRLVALERENEWIRRVVNAVKFSQSLIETKVKVGEKREASPTPTDDLDIQPIAGVQDLPRLNSNAHAYMDDEFYARLASKQLYKTQFMETQDVFRHQLRYPKKVMMLVTDVSGSMAGGRASWAARLCKMLIDRCIKENADLLFLTFNGLPRDRLKASTKEECLKLQRELSHLLRAEGSTSLDIAMAAMFEFMGEQPFDEINVVLVTDGTESINSNQVKEGLKDRKVLLHTVCIGKHRQELKVLSNGSYNSVDIPEGPALS